MLQVTQAPQGPVLVKQRFSILGMASLTDAGKALSLTVDGLYKTAGPLIAADGTWQVDFLFQQTGNRRLKIAVDDDSAEMTIAVVNSLPAIQRLRFTQVPSRLAVRQVASIEGMATNFPDGTTLILRSDRRFDLSRPVVRAGKWQSTIGFNQPGRRVIEIISSDGKDRAETELEVIEVKTRPPRVSFTNPPKQVKVEETVILTGLAENYANGDQLVLQADQNSELARPRVMDGKWQAQTVFRKPGNRLIEIIGSEQDKVQIVIEVQAALPESFVIQPRSSWTSTPTPASLPNLVPQRITIHHTFLPNAPAANASIATETARMRTIWNGHVNGNGWSDIGYHFIIMPSGRVYVARAETKRGAHDGINDGLGVAFDGIYSTDTINLAMYETAVKLCVLLCKRYGIKNTITPVPTPTDFGSRNLPLICGHRDRVATACPGSEGGKTVRLADIRQAVNAQL